MYQRKGSLASLSGHETLSKLLSTPPLTNVRRGSMPVIASLNISESYASKATASPSCADMMASYHNPDGSRCVPGSPDFLNEIVPSNTNNTLPSPSISSLFGQDWNPTVGQKVEESIPAVHSEFRSGSDRPIRNSYDSPKPAFRRNSDFAVYGPSTGSHNSYTSPSSYTSSAQSTARQFLPSTTGQFGGSGTTSNGSSAQFSAMFPPEMDAAGQLVRGTPSPCLRESFSNQSSEIFHNGSGGYWGDCKPSVRGVEYSNNAQWTMNGPSQQNHQIQQVSVTSHSPFAQSAQMNVTNPAHSLNQNAPLPKLSQVVHSGMRIQELGYHSQRFTDGNAQRPGAQTTFSDGWNYKSPYLWNNPECMGWFRSVAQDHGLNPDYVNWQAFQGITGPGLAQMGAIDFLARDSVNGQLWFRAIQKVLDRQPFHVTHEPVIPKSEPMDMDHEFDHNIPFLSSSMQAESTHDTIERDLSEYIQDPFTRDEFDDIITLDSSAYSATGQLMYNSGVPLSMAQYVTSGRGPTSHNFSGSMTSDSPDCKTDLDSDLDSCRSSSCQNSTFTDSGTSSAPCSYGSISPADWSSSSPEIAPRRPLKTSNKGEKSKGGRRTRGNHLWEFIRDLLKNPKYCPKFVKWENREEGVFRFVESESVAKMWGNKKCNPRMTYEKLSRAMRTYYGSHILVPVPKTGQYPKKLVYKFGPKAVGWRTD